MSYNKQTGDIYKHYDKPKNVLDKIASRHDICYELKPKNKGLCDRIMVKEIDNVSYKDKCWGTYAIKQIINTKQKLGMGNFTMENLSEDSNVKIYYTHSNLKAVIIERFNRSLRELMMKSFVKNNNTVWYNILPELIKT